MKLVITEKPSVAMTIAKVIGAKNRFDGYLEGNGYLVSWCIGHLVEMVPPKATAIFTENGGWKPCPFSLTNGSIRYPGKPESSMIFWFSL